MAQMKTTVIRTQAGTLELVPATVDQLRGIARYWRMELLAYEDGPPDFGLVFQHGNEEVYGVKMQCVDMPQADAVAVHGLPRKPLWNEVVRAGFRKLPYASMVPAGFAGEPPADL
jgi:hypothetical protein